VPDDIFEDLMAVLARGLPPAEPAKPAKPAKPTAG
jgi:hypothetical protein